MRSVLLSAIFSLGCLSLTAVHAEGPAVAKVNGVAIPKASADMLAAQGRRNGVPTTAQNTADIRTDLIRRELLWQEAKKQGYDKRPELKTRAESERQLLMAQAEMTYQTIIVREFLKDHYQSHPITDAQLRAVYDKSAASGKGTDYKARHILVNSAADANAVLSDLDAGQTFEAVALKRSLDASTKDAGGDMGWGSSAKYPSAVSDKLATMTKGQVLKTPVQTGNGFHILKLDDTRPSQPLPFESMRPLLAQQLQDQAAADLIARLRKQAKIE